MLDRPTDRVQATVLLARACTGDAAAQASLDPFVYEHLRSVAQNLLRRERPGHTLQPTALVHEAYMRLIDESCLTDLSHEQARSRFVGIAARVMRRLLVDHARQRHSAKRGGMRERVDLDQHEVALPVDDRTMIDLEDALATLERTNVRLAKIAELRLFGGLSVRDLAPLLGISPATAKADWALARAWLTKLLGEASHG